MSVVFFEGFNHDNSEAIKLDPNYWSSPDMPSISFGNVGRTHNSVIIQTSAGANGLAGNKRLDLSNFVSPLTSNNCFGIGFWTNQWSIRPNNRLISISNGGVEVLNINIIQTTYSSPNDSFGFQVLQNNVSKGIYDIRSVVGYNYSIWNSFVNSDIYLEFYIDPKDSYSLRIRANGMDMFNQSNNASTTISDFTNIDKISLFGADDSAGRVDARAYDDFYLSTGSTIENTLLGKEVRIYRLNPESHSSTMEWTSNRGWGPNNDLGSNDGDNSYYFVDTINKTALFNINNLPVSSGSVGGVKLLNTARKVSGNITFTNVYAPSDGQTINNLGPTHSVDTASYKYFNSFILKNPSTNNDWTINDVNNLQLGMKKLS